jgi:excisionase family DNA binding protein
MKRTILRTPITRPVAERDAVLCTIKELAEALSIKPSTLYAWAAQGRIPCLKIHGLVRFRRDDIERWIESFRIRKSPVALKSGPSGPRMALDELIARAKGQAYNSRPRGNQPKSSPIGKEETDGAV